MPTLSREQKQKLTAKAAQLNPVVMIGNKGLTEAIHKEIERALNDHELIKIRYQIKDRNYQQQTTELICQQHQAELVHSIGHIVVIYRKSDS